MTEDEARSWLDAIGVPRETIEKLTRFVELLRMRSAEQNLVASSTMPHIWARHIVDSAQLVQATPAAKRWIDLGSGAGLPGIVIGLMTLADVTLVEPRKLRVGFLREAIQLLGLEGHVSVVDKRAEVAPSSPFDVVTARAFAPLATILPIARRFSGPTTQLLLPKGRSAAEEVASVRDTWQGEFRLLPSVTDPDASIISVRHLEPRGSA